MKRPAVLSPVALCVAGSLCLVACSGIHAAVPDVGTLPPLHPYYVPAESVQYENTAMGKGQPYWARTGNQGRDFCKDLEDNARVLVRNNTNLGWGFGVGAIASLGTGVVLAAGQYDTSPGYRIATAGLPLLGTAFGYLALAYFSRGQDAQDVASTAAHAMGAADDRSANGACNQAIAAWNSTRVSSPTEASAPLQPQYLPPAPQPAPTPQPTPTPPPRPQDAPVSSGPASSSLTPAPPESPRRTVTILQPPSSGSPQPSGPTQMPPPSGFQPSAPQPGPAANAPSSQPPSIETPPIPVEGKH